MEATSLPAVRLSRTYAAAPEAVFRAWTDPALLVRWFSPTDEYAVEVTEFDATPGGRYRIEMRHDLGAVHAVHGTFEAVDAPRRLTMTWAWEGGPMAAEAPTRVEVSLAPDGEGTRLTLVHDGFDEPEAAVSHRDGWDGCLWRLANTFGATPGRRFAAVAALHRRLYANVLDGLSDEQLEERTGDANALRWIAAHLAQSRAGLAAMLGEPIEHPLEAYAEAVPADAEPPSLETIRDVFARASAALNRALRDVTDASLAGDAPFAIPLRDGSMAGMIDFLQSHEAYHLGQLGLYRRILGLPAMRYDAADAPVAA